METHDLSTALAEQSLSLKEKLIRDADDFCTEFGISQARLATIVANDGKFFDRIAGGGRVTTDMLQRFYRYFAERREALAGDGAGTESAA